MTKRHKKVDLRELHRKAQEYMKRGYFYNAEKTYKKILRYDPKDIQARNMLATIRFFDGDYDTAETYFKRSLKISARRNIVPLVYLGLIKFNENIEFLDSMLTEDEEVEDYVMRAYNEIITMNTNDFLTYIHERSLIKIIGPLTTLLGLLGKDRYIINLYDKFGDLLIIDGDEYIISNIGIAYANLGQFDKAETVLQRYGPVKELEAFIKNYLALIRFIGKHYKKAVIRFEYPLEYVQDIKEEYQEDLMSLIEDTTTQFTSASALFFTKTEILGALLSDRYTLYDREAFLDILFELCCSSEKDYLLSSELQREYYDIIEKMFFTGNIPPYLQKAFYFLSVTHNIEFSEKMMNKIDDTEVKEFIHIIREEIDNLKSLNDSSKDMPSDELIAHINRLEKLMTTTKQRILLLYLLERIIKIIVAHSYVEAEKVEKGVFLKLNLTKAAVKMLNKLETAIINLDKKEFLLDLMYILSEPLDELICEKLKKVIKIVFSDKNLTTLKESYVYIHQLMRFKWMLTTRCYDESVKDVLEKIKSFLSQCDQNLINKLYKAGAYMI
ncbi:MAG: tetratricopeptide repeat protein [Candidatus Odinarchaeota archaeon]|nr:tetratricopeptide repeat protein [Candidatus Odinarchaeota archaeon]